MKLLTVNLYNGRVDSFDLARVLDGLSPDIVCAQEVGPEAGRVLEERFGYGVVKPSLDFLGRAMVSVHELRVDTLELPLRSGLRGRVAMAGRPFDLVSAHLLNPLDGPAAVRARGEQATRIVDAMRGVEAGAVVGDMNATPVWPAYRRVAEAFDDGVLTWARSRGVRPPATWAPRPGWPAILRIDHAFTRGLEVDDVHAVPVRGLDHRALCVDLVWPA